MSAELHSENNEEIRASVLEKVRETSRNVVVSENNPEALKEQKKLFVDSVSHALEVGCSIEHIIQSAMQGVKDTYEPPSEADFKKMAGE